MPPGSWGWFEEPELLAYHIDAQTFLLAAHDVDGGEFTTFDTLQHGLARHAEGAHGLAHRQKPLAGFAIAARLEVISEADAPRGTGCQLLAGNDAVIK